MTTRTSHTGRALVTGVVALVLGARVAHAATPFGGDDLGFIPPDKPTLSCEAKTATNVAKLIQTVTGCHVKSADAGLKGKPFAEETCEVAARAKYDRANAALTGCPACLDAGAVADGEIGRLDGVAALLVYCDNTSGTPLADGDDSGFVPANRATAQCENQTTKRIAVLAKASIKCHNAFAARALKSGTFDDTHEDACEAAALAKYQAVVGALAHCPPCLTPVFTVLGSGIVDSVDTNGGAVYCASPSGTFLDDATGTVR